MKCFTWGMVLPDLNSLTKLLLGEVLRHMGFVASEMTLWVIVTMLGSGSCLWFGVHTSSSSSWYPEFLLGPHLSWLVGLHSDPRRNKFKQLLSMPHPTSVWASSGTGLQWSEPLESTEIFEDFTSYPGEAWRKDGWLWALQQFPGAVQG